jgi:glycogen synthase
MGANAVTVRDLEAEGFATERAIRELGVDSPLAPYMSVEQYRALVEQFRTERQGGATKTITTELTGDYGPYMMDEVMRYSAIAHAIAQSEPHDVIHVHDWMTFLAGIEARRASGKPLVAHVHSIEYDRSGEHMNSAIFDIERWGLEQADRIVAVSYYTKDLIQKYYGIPESKIRVVHNAASRRPSVNGNGASRALKEKIVLFLGRVTFQKGPDYFVEAAKKVLDKIDNVRFVMAGSGDMYNRMVERMAQLRIAHHFHFTGFLRGTDVERMFATSDLYVMPSVSEPFGIAPLEAMLYNVPIIVSKQSGVAEVLPGAIKVDFWDTDKLAESIIDVLTKPETARGIVEQCSDQLKEIKWERAAERVLGLYGELAATS